MDWHSRLFGDFFKCSGRVIAHSCKACGLRCYHTALRLAKPTRNGNRCSTLNRKVTHQFLSSRFRPGGCRAPTPLRSRCGKGIPNRRGSAVPSRCVVVLAVHRTFTLRRAASLIPRPPGCSSDTLPGMRSPVSGSRAEPHRTATACGALGDTRQACPIRGL